MVMKITTTEIEGPLSSLDGDQGCQVTIEMIGGKYGYV